MASAAYYRWLRDGKPYRLCRPAAALQRKLRGHGLTVYDYPNDEHLEAPTPEDHTSFSATGWPVKSAYGVGHAIDVMPRADTAAARAENAAIARRLIADRNAGVSEVAWIKYLNWTDEQGVCRQERWMPNHETRSSTDRGHIHVSGRSDCDDDVRADGYDPLEDALTNLGFTDKDGEYLCARLEALAHLKPVQMGPEKGQALELVELLKRLDAATAADKVRDDALAAAVKGLALGAGVDPDALMERINAAVTAAVKPLQDQVAAVQMRNLALARALAAAGGALDAADD